MGTYFLTLLITFFCMATHAETTLYQWVDENGVKHFSQQPPAHIPGLKAVDLNGLPVISGDEATENQTALPIATTDSPAIKQPEIERVENPKKDPERCEKAQKNIAQMQEFRRVRAKDPETGELRYLDDDEKADQLKNWRDRESTFC